MHMNLYPFALAALVTLSFHSLPAAANFSRIQRKPVAINPQERDAREGIIFRHYPYTLLVAKASSSRNSEEGVYDHIVVLRFHRDAPHRVDIKVMAPGETFDWKSYDESATYTIDKTEARLTYTLTEQGANALRLQVRHIMPASRNRKLLPNCEVRLRDSSYTYILGGGSKLFTYELAEEASIWAEE